MINTFFATVGINSRNSTLAQEGVGNDVASILTISEESVYRKIKTLGRPC